MGNSGSKAPDQVFASSGGESRRIEESSTAQYVGLENYGNTCYCNSVLQALYHCSPFRHHVIALAQKHQQQQATASDGQSSRDSPAPNNTDGTNDNKADKKKESAVDGFAAWLMSSTLMSLSPPGPQAGSPGTNGSSSSATPSDSSADKNHIPLWLALALLFKELGRSQEPAIGPKTFVRRLKEENVLFQNSMQQDAHEFLIFLLNDIHEVLQKENHTDNKDHKKEKETFIQSIFGGVLTNELKCLCCENVTIKKESFLDLALDIEQNTSITSCLKNFSSVETLAQQNKFYCDYCRSLQEAQKRMKIQKLPRVLIVQFKRFKYMESLGRFSKLSYRVSFPFELRICNTSYDAHDAEREYYLFAVVVHIGSGPNHGHYVSLIKSASTWLLFDDEKVSQVDETQIQNIFGSPYPEGSSKISKCGYLLFYTSEPNTTFDPELDGISFSTMGVMAS